MISELRLKAFAAALVLVWFQSAGAENSLAEAERLFKMGKKDEARAVVSKFITTNGTAQGYIKVANLYARLRKWSDAVHYLEIATTREERNALAWYELGLAYHQDKKTDNAVVALRRSIAISSTTPKSVFALGEILELARDRYDARNVYTAALHKLGERADLRAKLCWLNYQDSFFQDTIKNCRQAVELNPQDQTSWTLWAKTLYESQQKALAFKTFKSILSKFPRAALAYRARGLIYYDEKSYEQAASDLGKAFGLNPDDDEAAIHLARSIFELGHYEQALPIFVEATRLDPSYRFEFMSKQRELSRKNKTELANKYQDAIEKP